jgi:hypothetical protein
VDNPWTREQNEDFIHICMWSSTTSTTKFMVSKVKKLLDCRWEQNFQRNLTREMLHLSICLADFREVYVGVEPDYTCHKVHTLIVLVPRPTPHPPGCGNVHDFEVDEEFCGSMDPNVRQNGDKFDAYEEHRGQKC